MIDKTILQKAVWRVKDNLVQWLWFSSGVDKEHIGYDKGLLTWMRAARHKKLKRPFQLCLLDVHPKGGKFGRFTAFWINERSRICKVTVNKGLEDADVIWIYSQDPLPSGIKQDLMETLKRARPDALIINHPEVYNSYHEAHTFKMLAEAGVSVPRSQFTGDDIGKTTVVYKVTGMHGSSKFLSPYRGPIEGYRPFEFVDSRGPDGLYRKYRAFYLLGIVCPNHVAYSDHWNVHRETKKRSDYLFQLTAGELESIRLIARTLRLQYFAVDFLRRSSDDHPYVTDINVYPLPVDFTETARQLGYLGRWIILDNRQRLGIPEPSGTSFWDEFDEATAAFIKTRRAESMNKDEHKLG
jgi:hypothetical protein